MTFSLAQAQAVRREGFIIDLEDHQHLLTLL